MDTLATSDESPSVDGIPLSARTTSHLPIEGATKTSILPADFTGETFDVDVSSPAETTAAIVCIDDGNNYPNDAGNLTDEKFVADFKRLSRPSQVSCVLKQAALCADKKSFKTEKLTLQKIGLSKSKFSKLSQIGKDRRFDEIRRQLPDNTGYSVLYAMTRLSEGQWKTGFESGEITPKSSRKEIDAFREGQPLEKMVRNPKGPYFAVVRPSDGAREKDEFKKEMNSLCERFGFALEFGANDKQQCKSGGRR